MHRFTVVLSSLIYLFHFTPSHACLNISASYNGDLYDAAPLERKSKKKKKKQREKLALHSDLTP